MGLSVLYLPLVLYGVGQFVATLLWCIFLTDTHEDMINGRTKWLLFWYNHTGQNMCLYITVLFLLWVLSGVMFWFVAVSGVLYMIVSALCMVYLSCMEVLHKPTATLKEPTVPRSDPPFSTLSFAEQTAPHMHAYAVLYQPYQLHTNYPQENAL